MAVPRPVPLPEPPPILMEGDQISIEYRDVNVYPKKLTGVVEKVFPNFAVALAVPGGYRTTVHAADFNKVRKGGGMW